jgi:diguanylate cyclase (GGDEF)-like protein
MFNMNYEPEIQEVVLSGKSLNVLIVDDSKVIRSAIREILEIGNLQVTEACDGKQALESINESVNNKCLPDLVLLDIVMPVMDGISVLKELRKTWSKIQLPIILVTSQSSAREMVQALDLGANDYVTKPIDFDVLWARLTNQLMQKQAAEFLCSAQQSLEKQIKQRTAELKSINQQLEKEMKVRLLAEDRLKKQASYDALTGLPNRSLAADRLNQSLVKAKRHKLKPCVAFLDLDNFKYINDTFGHAAGDDLLKEAAKRLSECARGSDTVARLGGDEFLLILDDDDTNYNKISNYNKTSNHPETGIRHVAERIIKSFAKPFVIEGQELNITPSIGFAIYPKDGDDSNKLMRHADAAMYRSKNDGKNTYCFYSPEMTVQAKLRMKVESQLRHALERNEFYIEYQPIVNLKSGGIVKAEALLRWNCDQLGMITPDYFIPLAEETGMILPIGQWVIKQACEQVKNWRDSGWQNICVTINVSARQFQSDSSLVETVREALNKNNLPADAIQLELTEGILLEESTGSADIMKQIETMGIKLLIDDFGTGYASLSYLQRYNFDSLKIDRSYINNVLTNEQDAKLVKAVIAMANSLGMSVVSEGVETKEQLDFLLAADCEFMQGYYFSKPVSADVFVGLLKKTNPIHNSVTPLKLIHVGL